jgi:isovaleryl-CoA dehydrogenase
MTATTADFTAEQEMLRETTRAFAQQVVAPLAREIDRDQRFPSESWVEGARLGILGLCAPEEFGGAGLGLTEMCIVGEELSAVCVSTAATLLHQADLVIGRLVRHGSVEQKQRWLPHMCDGSIIGCLAITEPDAGSDALSMQTNAVPVDGGFVLSGAKTFITNGPVADVALVYARVAGMDGGLGLFMVEAGTKGFTKGRKFTKMGWRGSPTGELSFQECFVPTENVIGAPGQGREILFAGLNSERIVMAAESIGLTRGALEASIAYAKERKQFGKTIGEFQMVQEKLADMFSQLQAVSALTYRAATLVDRGVVDDLTLLASSCKLIAADLSMCATTAAVQVFGGYGYIDEYPVERFMRDAKLMQIGGGTAEIMRSMIARKLLK